MRNLEEIKKRARARNARYEKARRDPRYTKVIGRFTSEGLLEAPGVVPTRGMVTLEDALWVGEVEPRVLELLPALMIRRPKLLAHHEALPDDLREVVSELRRGRAHTCFRSIEPQKYAPWLERLGRKKGMPSVLKSFRFTTEDAAILEALSRRWGVGETEAIRKALRIAADRS